MIRRNKDCTRSVKKKSGPAKGTKYAARRARSKEDHHHLLSHDTVDRLGRTLGGASVDGALLRPPPRRPAPAGEGTGTPPAGSASSSSAPVSAVSTSLSFVPHEQQGLRHGGITVGGAEGNGVGREGGAGEELVGPQHTGVGDSESQHLISTFGGVLQVRFMRVLRAMFTHQSNFCLTRLLSLIIKCAQDSYSSFACVTRSPLTSFGFSFNKTPIIGVSGGSPSVCVRFGISSTKIFCRIFSSNDAVFRTMTSLVTA